MEEKKASSSMAELAVSNSTTTSQNRRPGHPILPGEIRQLFSLPESIIYYIAMHPSNAEVYKKLIRTCKYFYNQNPILVVYGLTLDAHENVSREDGIAFIERWEVEFKKNDYQPIDVDTVPCKFWVIDCFILNPWGGIDETLAASTVRKIYRSDATVIQLTGQTLTLDELLFLGSNATQLSFDNVKITENDNGKADVMFEKVIERFPKLKEIAWSIYIGHQNISCFSKNTAAELIKLPHFANITKFEFSFLLTINRNETLDAKVLFEYLKTCNKNMEVSLEYSDVSDQFKQKLDEIINEIISTQMFTYKPPSIWYVHLDQNKQKQMREIVERYRNTRF